jgi:hypothetical protein
MKRGDLVATTDSRYPLHCGSGIYPHAVVMQVEPLILVSESSDMKWSCLDDEQIARLAVIGKADKETIDRCMRRMS